MILSLYFHFVSPNLQSTACRPSVTNYDSTPSINAFSVKCFLYAVVCFPVFVLKIQNPKPGFDLVQTRNPGLEKDVRVWNPYAIGCSAVELQ